MTLLFWMILGCWFVFGLAILFSVLYDDMKRDDGEGEKMDDN